MHALVIYALYCSLMYSRIREAAVMLDVQILPPAKSPMSPLVLPEVDLQESRLLQVAPPEIVSEPPAETAPITVETPPDQPNPPETVAKAAPPEGLEALEPVTGPRPISGPHSADLYPSKSVLAHERGRVAMIICISPSGKVDDVQLATSSGFPRLDAAALDIAAQYRFKPAMRGGLPVPVCVRYQINFRINI
jgi:protein TonB